MQSLGSLAVADFLARVRKVRYKLELYDDDGAWHDLFHMPLAGGGTRCLVKSWAANPSGAAVMPELAAGTFTAEIKDPDGRFNLFNDSSAYKDWFRVGRKIRISIGLDKAGVITYFTRFTGYIDNRSYDLKSRVVSITGSDAMKRLADYTLGEGDRFWGGHEHFTSVATGGAGTELYDEADACEIGAGEAGNVTNWTGGPSSSGGVVSAVAGVESTFALQFARDEVGPTKQSTINPAIVTLAAGQTYIMGFWAAIPSGENYARLNAYETVGGALSLLNSRTISPNGGDWTYYSMTFTASTATALQLEVSTEGKYALATDVVQVDEISVKTYDPATWYVYDLPAECNGVYAVTVDGEFVEQGEGGVLRDASGAARNSSGGWHYDAGHRQLCFSEQMQIEAGLDVVVYYFTTASLEDMVARLLWKAHLYTSEALAKAAMSYTVSGVTVLRPWFKAGASALEAIRQICERADYRFWVGYDETPHFKPAPTLKATADFTLPAVGNTVPGRAEEGREWIRNRISIEGDEQAALPGTDEKPTKLTAEASDTTSITLYGETTLSWKNQLYQDVTALGDMVDDLLAAYKDPKKTSPLTLPFSAVPFEPGDSLTFRVPISPGVSVEKKAIIRTIALSIRSTVLGLEFHEGYPVMPLTPDIGAIECAGTAAAPTGIPDLGAIEIPLA